MKRILIVDDDEAIRLLYADEFAEEGYEVITSGDGSSLLEIMEKEYGETPEIYTREIPRLSALLDRLRLVTFEAYVRVRERLIKDQAEVMAEIETPISQIWRNILLIPIIGPVDSRRAQMMMDKMLQKILETESKIIILDITGVPMVDTAVATIS